VQVEIERTPKALDQGHRAGAGTLGTEAGLADQMRGNDAVDDAQADIADSASGRVDTYNLLLKEMHMPLRIHDIHGIGRTMAQAEALEHELQRLRSAGAPHIGELISRGLARELALPAMVDHSSHVRYVRDQGAWGCGMNAEAAIWDILLDMYCPPNFHPNISVNRMLWAKNFTLSCFPHDKPCGERKPGTVPGLGVPAAAGSALTSTTLGDDPRVYYLVDDQRQYELAWWGDNWHCRAVSADAGGPTAAAGSALTSTTLGGDPRVYYLADDHRIHELAWWGDSWHYRAVSADAGGPTAAAGSALTSTTLGGDPRVYYLADDHRIHELAWWGNNWHYRAVSADAGGPTAAAGSALTSTTLGGDPRIYYLADDHRIHELAWWDDKWHCKPISHHAASYATYEDYLYYEGCATEGSELTNSDGVQWPTNEGDHEISNFRLDRHVLANPGEYRKSVPVTVEDLRYWLAGGPVRVGIWGTHFVALVGYDDTAKRFKFLNSWGDQWVDKWGDKGFGYVDYSNLKAEIQSAQVYQFVPSKATPCLRVKFSHTWRQDVYLWIGIEGATKCKRIWPTGQRQDDSHNLWLTVTLPAGFAWPPTQQNRVYLDVYDCGAHSSSGGLIEEVLTGYDGNYVACADLAGGSVPFKPGKMTRLTVP